MKMRLDETGVNRRSVLKAIGATAIAGGAFTGSALAQASASCPSYSVEFNYQSGGWSGGTAELSVDGDARNVTITNVTTDCNYTVSLAAKGGQCDSNPKSATLAPGESIGFTSADFGTCYADGSGDNPNLKRQGFRAGSTAPT
jgi:hypothetical protein